MRPIVMIVLSLFAACSKPAEMGDNKNPGPQPIHVIVDPSTTHQTIAGYGGGNMMWGTNFLTVSQLKTAFGTGEDDLGMTIFRVRLSSDQNEWAALAPTLKESMKYDIKIIASPWSPPADLKSNNNTVGGELLEANYEAFANYINDFTEYMSSQGVTIDVVSVQNEPDVAVTYESCDWSATQILNFVKDYGSMITAVKLAAAESFNFKQPYTDAILSDPIANANLDIVAGHIYGGGLADYPLAEQHEKEIWMTEYLLNLNASSDWSTITEGTKWEETMRMLKTVHESMTSNWNAYVWWYIRRYYSFIGDGEQGTTLGKVLKRGYAMSQYAKFIQPGYVRVDADHDTNADLDVTAYSGDNKIVVVLTNTEDHGLSAVELSVPGITAAESYTTALSKNREKGTLTVEDGSVTVSMGALSVTTVVISL